jgi:hypothetical protein
VFARQHIGNGIAGRMVGKSRANQAFDRSAFAFSIRWATIETCRIRV